MKFQHAVTALLFYQASNISTFISAKMEYPSSSAAANRSTIATESGLTHVRKRNITSQNSRRLQAEPCTLLLKVTNMEDGNDFREVECFDTSTGDIFKISGAESTQEELLAKFDGKTLTSNMSTLKSIGAYFTGNGKMVLAQDLDNAVFDVGPNMHAMPVTVGTKEMLALRIVASDVSTTSSEEEISDAWFGTYGDPVNIKSQYKACSYDKLICIAADTGNGVDGVRTVTITNTVTGNDSSSIVSAAVDQAKDDLNLTKLSSEFDHVMLCIPPGTNGNWIAYAYINHWLSVYNDKWCNYVSGQMHEIGHNLGLAHSGEGENTYADQTGMMGYSYSGSDSPVMCFNAPKNWQLGWYNDRQAIVYTGWSGNIYGIADYGSTSTNDTVIVQIPGTEDWYVSFNRQLGINSGTREGKNQVLVHKRPTGGTYGASTLMTKMNTGDTYTNAPLDIIVNAIDLSTNPVFASVTIGNFSPTKSPTNIPTSIPEGTPTVSPVMIDTSSPTKSPINSPTNTPEDTPSVSPVTSPPTDSPVDHRPTLSPTSISCSSYSKKKFCKKASCVWSRKFGECFDSKPLCSPYGSKQSCNQARCYWQRSSSQCLQKRPCTDRKKRKNCLKKKCSWTVQNRTCS